nr:RHS repeat domain-containing protein [Paraburkholderia sp. BCC1886]
MRGLFLWILFGAGGGLWAFAASAQADEIAYAYDALGRLVSVSVAGSVASYDYDAAGNVIAIRRAVSEVVPP